MIKIITHTALRMLFIIILLNTAVSFGHNIPINQTFTQDGQVYEFQTPDPVYSCKITGNISLNSEISLIRVILISETNEEFLIYEMFPSVYENSTLADAYYETCYLDGVVPDQIKVQIVDASITINSFNIEDGYIENAVQLQETEKLNIENSRIELLNDYIVENELIWYAGMNSNVEMTYEEKRNLFEDGEVPNFQGMEYYVGGYFSYGTTIPDPVESDIVDNFDWRNRHGANNPSSLYWDGDDENWSGWIPKRWEEQGDNNDCYAFAPTYTIEALTNLYFNQHLDINLSQQDVISCINEIPYDGFYYANYWENKPTGFPNDLNSVYFKNLSFGFAVGNDGIIVKTIDKGDNWILQNSNTFEDLNSICFNSGNGFVSGNSGTILKTTNNGSDWIVQSSGTSVDLNTVFFINSNIGYIVGNNGTIINTANGGNNWTIQSSGTSVDLHSVFFTEADINTGYAVGNEGTIIKTLNGGGTWFPLSSGTNEDLFSIYFLDENNSNIGYMVGNSGVILMTSDGGVNWSTQPSGVSNLLSSVFFTSELFGYIVGDNGILLKTTDGGLSWSQLSSWTNNSLSCITFYSYDRYGYIVGENGSFLRVGNGGSTGKSSYYITYNGIVNEDCFPYVGTPVPPCSDRCSSPDEIIQPSSYDWYLGTPQDEFTIKNDIIENGCLVARTFTTMGHAMILVGYGKVRVGDEIFFVPPMDEEIIIPHGSPYIGQTYWIFEQSWGLWNNETTFIYIIIPPELLRIHIMKEPITSLNQEDIACLDEDNDGYFNWGIADTKPPTCPTCPPEPDCDDSNPWLGPFDSEYNCQLLCENFTYQPGPYYINSTVTFQDIHYFDSDVIVTSGNEMIVEGEIGFVEGAKLIVQRNAKLTINGGLVTGTCGNLWQGIEVWGNYNKHQSYNYQGAVEIINGGTIENAVYGINTISYAPPEGGEEGDPNYAFTGGMVLADGGIFRNNRTAVKFWPYNYSSSSSFFRNCQFITDDGLLPGTDPDNFIEMSDISGVHILGGSFTDSHTVTYPDELTTGIEAYNAGFYIWSYYGPSLFTGLYDGIRAYTHNPEKTINIINGQFSNNLRSVYLSSFIETKITGNEFNPWDGDVPEEEESYCLYLDYCTDYTVEENVFIHTGQDPTGIGLVINNSGPDNNEIYRNDFTNLEYATLAQNCNRDESPLVGLKIKCNDYWDNYQDIAVTAFEEVEYPGIARSQGAEGSTEMQAGNLFSLNNNGIDISDYSTFKESPITYYHHDPGLSNEPRVEPVYISKFITLDNQFTYYDEELSCPPSQTGGGSGGTIEDLLGDMASSQYKADSTEALLTTLVDGGDSEVLEQEVLQSMPPETYDLYMSLMGKSPYLSDSVLMAAIEKENVLPNVLIKDILVANPQAAKSNEVMDKVEEKSNPLQQDLLAEVLLGQYIVAAKEKLEANVAYYKNRRSTALKYLKQLYRNDTVNAWAKDSLIYLLESEDGLQEKYELIFAYANQDDWIGATNLLNSLSLLYNMNTQQQEIYEEMQQFINVIHGLYLSDSTIYGMTDIQKAALYDLTDYSQNIAGAYARGILIETDGYEYTEPIILPGAGLKSGNIVFDLPNIETFIPEHVKIYPNPALDYIIIEMNTGNATGAIVSLFDNQGRPVRSVNIPAQQQHYVLGLKNIPAGIYIVKVNCNGKNVGNKKFSIVK